MVCFLKRRRSLVALGAILGLVLAVSAAQAGKITLGTPVATADGGLDVAVNVTPDSGQNVAALQFDLHYDSSQYGFADVISGGAATGAGKDAAVSETEPGTVRVVVAGINQDTLGSGTVATLHFERMDKTVSAPSFSDNTTLDEVVASGPSGENIDGLNVYAAVSESPSIAATAPNTKTPSNGTSASPQGNVGKAPAGAGVTGFAPALEAGRDTLGLASQRSMIGMGPSVGSRGSALGAVRAMTPALPTVSGGVPPRRVLESPSSGKSGRAANGSHGDTQFPEVAGTPSRGEKTFIAGNPSRASSAGRADGNTSQTLASGTDPVSSSLPAVAASQTAEGAVKMSSSSNSGILVLFAGSFVVLLLMLGAWVVRRS